MSTSAVFLILIEFVIYLNGARILGIVPTISYSHQTVFHPIWRELSLRGHQVTTITSDPIKDPSLTNLTEIDFHYVYKEFKENKDAIIDELKRKPWRYFLTIFEVMTNISDLQLQHPKVKNLIQNDTEHFDLLMIEASTPIPFAFVEKFKCPIIGISSLDAKQQIYSVMGNPTHPVLNPSVGLPFAGKLNFMERLISTLYPLINNIFYKYSKSNMQEVANKHFGKNTPDLDEILQKIDMLFINTDPILHPIRALVPAIVQIGTGIHLKASKPLPENYQVFLDGATEGAIYFSLGSNAQSKDLSSNTMRALLQSFSKLPYRVLWKFEEDLKDKPDNVLITKWGPQQDILRHPNIKLFISQCGLQSTEEAMYSGVPILAMPMFGDQFSNAKLIQFKGMGLIIYQNSLSEIELSNKIMEIVNNPKYRNQVRKLAQLAKDQPMTGLEKAIWWTEYVLRHKGAKHLKSPATNIPLYQYYILDVIGFCAVTTLAILYLILIVVRLFYKLVKYLLQKRYKLKIN